eukprot:10472721-Alexandrium_andersonii.AAC.1
MSKAVAATCLPPMRSLSMARAVRIHASCAPRPLTPANMAGEMVACSHPDIWAKRSLAHVL